MRRLFTIFLIILTFHQTLLAQGIFVESFELLSTDLTAIMRETQEIDQNGEVAALIKMVTTQTGFVIDGGMMGIVKTKQDVAELWIYVPHGIQRLVIKHQQLGQLEYYFPIPIEKGRTYKMVLTTDELIIVRRPRQTEQTDSLSPAVPDRQTEAVLSPETASKIPEAEASKEPPRQSAHEIPYRYKHLSLGGGIMDERITGDKKATAANLGFYVKADYDLRLVGPLSLRPGLCFEYNSEGHEGHTVSSFFKSYNLESSTDNVQWTDTYFNIPIPLAFNFRLGDYFAFGLYCGPMLCFCLSNIQIPLTDLGGTVTAKSQAFRFMLACGLTIDIMNTIRISAGYNPGLYFSESDILSQKPRRDGLFGGISILF